MGPPPFIPFSSVKKSRKTASNIGFSTRKVSHTEHPVRRDGVQSASKTPREVHHKENHDKRTDYPNNFTTKSSKTLLDNKPVNPGIRPSGGGGTDSGKQHHQRQGYGHHTGREDKRSNPQNPNVDGRENNSARTDRSQDRGSQSTATARPQTSGPRKGFQRNQVFSSALQSASIGNIRESTPKSSHSSDKAQSQPVCDSKGSQHSITESTQKSRQSQQRVQSEGIRHNASESRQPYRQLQQRVHSEGNRHNVSESTQKSRQSQQRVQSEGNRHNASESTQPYRQSQQRVHSGGRKDVPTKHTEPSDRSPQVKKAPREPVTQPQFNSQSKPQNEPQRKGVPFTAKRVDVSSSVPAGKRESEFK